MKVRFIGSPHRRKTPGNSYFIFDPKLGRARSVKHMAKALKKLWMMASVSFDKDEQNWSHSFVVFCSVMCTVRSNNLTNSLLLIQVPHRTRILFSSYRCPTELSPGQTQVPKLEPQRKGYFSCLSYYATWVGVQPMFSNPRTLVQLKLSGI